LTAFVASSAFENSTAAFPLFRPADHQYQPINRAVHVNLQTLNKGKSNPVTRPYSPKISSKCPLCTFLLKPEITITRYPPAGLELGPFAPRGDLDLDLDFDRAGDMETSDPRRRRGGGDGDNDFGVRERPLPLSDMLLE